MKKILIISANYYMKISSEMSSEAKNALDSSKSVDGKKKLFKYEIINVPGVFEIPVIISKNFKKYDGFIALGCVIKGETPHFDFISQATTNAIMKLSIDYKKPVGNGIITCLNKEQAEARSKKGREAAEAVISVLSK
tara:strand:- start:263 stop:673 length:411 start_codon:yes stop_codon:yes gene_type:complete